MSVTEQKQPWIVRKYMCGKGFFEGFLTRLDHVFQACKWTKTAFAPFIWFEAVFFEHDTFRWKKQNAFIHQSYDDEIGAIERFDLQVIQRKRLLYQVPIDDFLGEYNSSLMHRQAEQMKQWRTSLGGSGKAMGKDLGGNQQRVAWEKEERIMTQKLWEWCFGFRKKECSGVGRIFMPKKKKGIPVSWDTLGVKMMYANAYYRLAVWLTASMSAAFCLPEQFRFRRWLLTASACAVDVRANSSRCPSGVAG